MFIPNNNNSMPHSSIYPPMLYVLNSRGNVLISLVYLQVLAGIDVDKPHQMSLRAEYNITGFPTLYYFEYVLSHSAFVYTVIFNTFLRELVMNLIETYSQCVCSLFVCKNNLVKKKC